MRSIKKGPEPALLLQHRKTTKPGKGTFDDLETATKAALREHLVSEQGYLCAAVADALEVIRERKPTGTWSAERIAQAVVTWERPDARGQLRPYLGAVLYKLTRLRPR